jgi:hypothetical protein
MKSETLKQNLNAIRDYISGIKEMKESSEVQLVRSQLRVIEKTIRQFERDGIQVPEGVMGDKLSLESKIKEIKKVLTKSLCSMKNYLTLLSRPGAYLREDRTEICVIV